MGNYEIVLLKLAYINNKYLGIQMQYLCQRTEIPFKRHAANFIVLVIGLTGRYLSSSSRIYQQFYRGTCIHLVQTIINFAG